MSDVSMRTPHGFAIDTGKAMVKVERLCTFYADTPKETHVLSVTTTPASGRRGRCIEVSVTAAGGVRVFDMSNPHKVAELVRSDGLTRPPR